VLIARDETAIQARKRAHFAIRGKDIAAIPG